MGKKGWIGRFGRQREEEEEEEEEEKSERGGAGWKSRGRTNSLFLGREKLGKRKTAKGEDFLDNMDRERDRGRKSNRACKVRVTERTLNEKSREAFAQAMRQKREE